MITLKFDFQPEEIPGNSRWASQMGQLGEIMANNQVRHIIFAHGTFAGDDPLGINNLLGQIEAVTGIPLFKTATLREFTKNTVDSLTKDLGNFTRDYINSFNSVIQNNISCEPFVWSGGNHHMARLTGTVELCDMLVGISQSQQENDRILLLGHSHAGQVFALLTTLLEQGDKADELFTIVEESADMDADTLAENLNRMSNVKLDIVTFGTPIRYRWGRYEHYRLMSIINDRGNNVDFSGILSTRDGDYVQQWATEGSDILSESLLGLNKELNEILLNKGLLFPHDFISRLEGRHRKEPLYYDGTKVTETFLVDYQDQDEGSPLERFLEFDGIPHCISTLFGHGIYTRKKAMLFNTQQIVNHFY